MTGDRVTDFDDDQSAISRAVSRALGDGCVITSIEAESAGPLGALSDLTRVRVSIRDRSDVLLIMKKEPLDAAALDVIDMLGGASTVSMPRCPTWPRRSRYAAGARTSTQ